MTLQSIIPAHTFSGFISAIQTFRANLAERRETTAAYDETFRELSGMSDRDLADIGIRRSDIPRIAADAVITR